MLLQTPQGWAALDLADCCRQQDHSFQGLSLNKHRVTFNHKSNVNECNQVIRMCSGMVLQDRAVCL